MESPTPLKLCTYINVFPRTMVNYISEKYTWQNHTYSYNKSERQWFQKYSMAKIHLSI